MKAPEGKFIGINQRVPFKVLDDGLLRLLQTGKVDGKALLEDLFEHTGGQNRALKASKYAITILNRPEQILKALKTQISAESYQKISIEERKALITALLACAFPFAYDLMVVFAAGFKVQKQINRAYVTQKMGALYGSNRTLEIALDALLPMLIDLNIIQREKAGIYIIGKPVEVHTSIIVEACIYADIKCSGSKSILVQDLGSRPWFLYFPVRWDKQMQAHLIHYVEAQIGGGYLTIG